jgi:membrane peptidoglycan carboxypeptidase
VLRHQIQLLDRASRLVFTREPSPGSQLRYHAGSIAGTVILSQKWSFDDIVDTTIGESWYGRDARGMEAASLAYFGVRLSELSQEESLALIVLLRGPSSYDPVCKRERFEDRYSILATRLKMDPGPTSLHKATSRMLPLSCH